LKFAFFNHTLRVGSGIDTVIVELASRLAKRHSVSVFCFQTDYNEDQFDFDIHEIHSPLASTTNRISVLAPFLMDKVGDLIPQLETYDIINTHIFPANYIVRNMRNPLKVVTEWTVGDPTLWPSSIKQRMYIKYLLRRGNKVAVQNADLVISSSKFIRNWVHNNYQITPELLYIDGINFELLDRNKSTTDSVFSLHPTVEGKQIILFVGRVTDHKNIHTLIDSFAILRKRLGDVALMIIGDYHNYMQYYLKLVSAIRNKGLERVVVFTGVVPWRDLSSYYSAASIYATCTLWEGFLRPESFAFAKPIVCFDVGPNSETVVDGKNGFLVKQIGAEPFAEAMYKLLTNSATRQQFGENGYEWARKTLDFNNISVKFGELCEAYLRTRL
jgi:glycosyltransferase involved in cell wall biosynthesis